MHDVLIKNFGRLFLRSFLVLSAWVILLWFLTHYCVNFQPCCHGHKVVFLIWALVSICPHTLKKSLLFLILPKSFSWYVSSCRSLCFIFTNFLAYITVLIGSDILFYVILSTACESVPTLSPYGINRINIQFLTIGLLLSRFLSRWVAEKSQNYDR